MHRCFGEVGSWELYRQCGSIHTRAVCLPRGFLLELSLGGTTTASPADLRLLVTAAQSTVPDTLQAGQCPCPVSASKISADRDLDWSVVSSLEPFGSEFAEVLTIKQFVWMKRFGSLAVECLLI